MRAMSEAIEEAMPYRQTFVIEYPDPSHAPRVAGHTEVLGGRLVAAQFSDALKEIAVLRGVCSPGQLSCVDAAMADDAALAAQAQPAADRPALADALPELIARLHDIAEEEAEQCNDSTAGPCSQAAAVLQMVLDGAPAREPSSSRSDAASDRAYLAGMQRGWTLRELGAAAGYRETTDAYRRELVQLPRETLSGLRGMARGATGGRSSEQVVQDARADWVADAQPAPAVPSDAELMALYGETYGQPRSSGPTPLRFARALLSRYGSQAPDADLPPDVDALIESLESFIRAYPEDVFLPVTAAEREEHGNLITRNSAAMGRHCGRVFAAPAVAMLRKLAAQVSSSQAGAQAGLSWNGHTVTGDKASIAAVLDAVEAAAARRQWQKAQAGAQERDLAQAIAAERERCKQAIRETRDKSGVNDDGQGWLMRATRADFIAAIDAQSAEGAGN